MGSQRGKCGRQKANGVPKGKWGAIDKEGKVLVPFEFQSIGVFEDGIAEVIYKSINLYVNRRGEILPK